MLTLPAIIGHRGAAALAPENSLSGFVLAARLGCTMVEFDVRLSADGVPVVFHDDTLDRCTSATGPLAARSTAVLNALGIPTLAETLDLCRSLDLAVNIELKPDRGSEIATARAALRVAGQSWSATRPLPLISSFSRRALATAADLCPRWPRGLLVGRLPGTWLELARVLGCVTLHAEHSRLTAARITAIRAAGLQVLAYTVNRPQRAECLLQRGISAVFSDHPDLLSGKSIAMS
jgi:glycerophosphoryl diester phosphodiesterase